MGRAALQARWLDLTRRVLPGLATERGWPIRNDHCFQRVLLDAVCGGVWYDTIVARPAYRSMDAAMLGRAVDLADAMVAGTADLVELNARSLGWRSVRRLA